MSVKRITTGTVNAAVKRITNHAQLRGKYSGHSLRIGGATRAMKAELTLLQIMSIGDGYQT
ncbi:15754_t:CDS:1, partial [Gigaspora margarita]